MKECSTCYEAKPFSDFPKRGKSGKTRNQCKVCHNADLVSRQRARRAAIRVMNQLEGANPSLSGEEEFPLDTYNEFIGQLCSLCGETDPHAIDDHCRHTGRQRGVLCVRCFALINNANQDPGVLRRATIYLEEL